MCIISKESFIAEEDIIAYKIVRATLNPMEFMSQFSPEGRTYVEGYMYPKDPFDQGTILAYIIGEETTSKSPGIFTYRTKKLAYAWRNKTIAEILMVLIPKGTVVRRSIGWHIGEQPVLAAERIKVLERVY